MRTPAVRRASSLGRGEVGDQGYSQASRSGVAQYELGMGRRRVEVFVWKMISVGEGKVTKVMSREGRY